MSEAGAELARNIEAHNRVMSELADKARLAHTREDVAAVWQEATEILNNDGEIFAVEAEKYEERSIA